MTGETQEWTDQEKWPCGSWAKNSPAKQALLWQMGSDVIYACAQSLC